MVKAKTYKVLEVPADVNVTGESTFHVLRSEYKHGTNCIVHGDNLNRLDAENLRINLMNVLVKR